jgi:GTP-binding protein
MRREGYELEVAKPEVVIKTIEGTAHEPVEECEIVVPNEYVGVISQELGKRNAELIQVQPITDTETSFDYVTSTRSLLGLRSILLNLTKGTVVINSRFMAYKPVGQDIPQFRKGVIISDQTGRASEYGLRNLKGRGISFIVPGIEVYQGMIVGLHAKDDDISMNVCKEKNLTNHRSKSHQGIVALAPDIEMSLEACLDFLAKDELLEITPISLRLRKKLLTELDRRRSNL